MIIFPDLTFACSGAGDCCSSYEVRRNTGEQFAASLPPGDRLVRLESSGACWYLKNKRCSIYEVRPEQCRQFPFEAINTPVGKRITLSPECACVLEETGGPIFADPSALMAAEVSDRIGPAAILGEKIEVDEDLPPISFQQYALLEARMIELGAEGALILLQQVLTELPVLIYASEPVKLALQRGRKIEKTTSSYPFKLWLLQGYPARSGSLRKGLIELRRRWEQLMNGTDPVFITRQARLAR